jgi:hypothetical protein
MVSGCRWFSHAVILRRIVVAAFSGQLLDPWEEQAIAAWQDELQKRYLFGLSLVGGAYNEPSSRVVFLQAVV